MTAEKETKPPVEIIEPYETLGPCRSRIIAGGIMFLIGIVLIFAMSG